MSLCEDLGYVDPEDTLPEFEEDAESVNRALRSLETEPTPVPNPNHPDTYSAPGARKDL